MELVKKGTKLEEVWEGTCSHCGSQFRATKKELEKDITDDQRDGRYCRRKCTECSEDFFLYPVTTQLNRW